MIAPTSPPAEQSLRKRIWQVCCQKGATSWSMAATASTRIGVWLMSILATVAAPCIPIFIEFLKNGTIKSDSIFITATVMSAAFAVSAEHVLWRALYFALFVVNLILDIVSGPFDAQVASWAGTLLLSVASLHVMERAWWHIALNRPFPEATQR
jgi:predicted Na+-dependent transporter